MQLDFQKKQLFLESVPFHSEILGATKFGLVRGNCIANAMIFIKIYIVKLSRVGFLLIVEDPYYDYFGYVGQIMPCLFFFKSNYKILGYQ